jgi:hypothetical protein
MARQDEPLLDVVAKSLATKLTRREAITKCAAVAAFIGANSMPLGSRAFADTGQSDPNVITGTCEQYLAYRDSTGVTDANGEKHKHFAGWTSYEIRLRPLPKTKPKITGSKGSGWCASAVVSPVFAATDIKTRILRWRPEPSPCCNAECTREHQRWRTALAAHERRHQSLARKSAALATSRHRSTTIERCSPVSSRDAVKRLNAAIQAELGGWLSDANAADDTIHERFDRSPGGRVRDLNCDVCAPSSAVSSCVNGSCRCSFNSCGTACCERHQICQNGQCMDHCAPGAAACVGNNGVGCCAKESVDRGAVCTTGRDGGFLCCVPGGSHPSVCAEPSNVPDLCCSS